MWVIVFLRFLLHLHICVYRVRGKLSEMRPDDCDIMNLTASAPNPVRDDSDGQIEGNLSVTPLGYATVP